jgi:hypothetical protein
MLKKRKNSAAQFANDRMVDATTRHPQDDVSYNFEDEIDGGDAVEETARYIADMIGSLAHIARQAKFDLLTYLLDMARVEAEMQARQSETPLDND